MSGPVAASRMLVVSDLDGTLLRPAGRLSATTAGCNMVLMQDVYAGGQWWLELTFNVPAMLEIADIARAVANAAPAVRARATQVIGDNAGAGVAAWISDHALAG